MAEQPTLQFSTSYLAEQDRILLRGRFPDGTAIRLLFTRRLMHKWLAASEQLAERLAGEGLAGAANPALRREAAQMVREAALAGADTSQPFVEGAPHPVMAAGPRLVTGVSMTAQPGEAVALGFTLDEGERVDFALPAVALWNLLHLLGRQAERADWNIAPPPPGGSAAPQRVN